MAGSPIVCHSAVTILSFMLIPSFMAIAVHRLPVTVVGRWEEGGRKN